jgi:hypothetical protein
MRGRCSSPVLAAALIVGCSSAAVGQTKAPVEQAEWTAPTFNIKGSLWAPFTDNALQSQNDRHSDFYYGTDLKGYMSGDVLKMFEYSLYARGVTDAFLRVKEGNDGLSIIGGNISKTILGFDFLVTAEKRWYYDGIFRTLSFIAYDYKGTISRKFTLLPGFTVEPGLMVGRRESETLTKRRYVYDLTFDFVLKVTDQISIVSAPEITVYDYTDGANAGRRDIISAAGLGVKYLIAKDVSLTISAGRGFRKSSFAGNDYRVWEFRPNLDFKF